MRVNFSLYVFIFSCLTLLCSNTSYGEGSVFGQPSQPGASSLLSDDNYEEPEFLDVDEAFKFTPVQQGNEITLHWQIADEHYLYKTRFSFSLEPDHEDLNLVDAIFSKPGKPKDDLVFGLVDVFYHEVKTKHIIELSPTATAITTPLKLLVVYQGCADAGLCYPPQTRQLDVDVEKLIASKSGQKSAAAQASPSISATSGAQSSTTQSPLSQDQKVTSLLQDASMIWVILTLYALGVGLAFTPCVLPMVPILSSIIAGQKEDLSTRKAFILSLVYVLAMAFTYSIAGVLVGYFGNKANIQMHLQAPPVLISFALIFVLLALSMFGFYELRLPSALQNRLDELNRKQQGGNYIGVAIMGIISALVVSPCVSAPLIGVLTYISSTGDGVLGGISLFALALGMGTPLLIIGTGGGKLIPQAGVWMEQVKALFGLLLLAVALWLLERILPGPLTLFFWGSLLMVGAVYLGAFDAAAQGWQKTKKGLCLIAFIYGVLLILGAASGQVDPLRPINLAHYSNDTAATIDNSKTIHRQFRQISNNPDLDNELALAQTNAQYMMLDYYADWCISCKIFERQVFASAEVQAALKDTHLVQADLSDLNDDGQALLQRFGLFGLPAILFFDPQGNEISDARIQGELNKEQFLRHLQRKVFTPN